MPDTEAPDVQFHWYLLELLDHYEALATTAIDKSVLLLNTSLVDFLDAMVRFKNSSSLIFIL